MTTRRQPVRSLLMLLAPLFAILLVASACSDEQKRDIEGAAVRAELEDEVRAEVEDEDLEIDELECEADIADESTVTGSCTGTTTDDTAIEATLDGTVDVDEATCESALTITVDGTVIEEDPEFDCLDN